MVCPICTQKARHLWFIAIKGSRTNKYSPLFFCNRCNFFFQRPDYHEDEQQLKRDLEWHLSSSAESHKDHLRHLLSQVMQILPNAKTLLDIGCGTGVSILLSRELGLSAEGVEPNPYAVEWAKNNFSLSLKQAYFEANLFNNKFDIIIADSVLEHVSTPKSFMRDVFSVLNPGGILWLSVPGRRRGILRDILRLVYSAIFTRDARSLFVDNDVHINHFSQTSVAKLIDPFGATLLAELQPGTFIIKARA